MHSLCYVEVRVRILKCVNALLNRSNDKRKAYEPTEPDAWHPISEVTAIRQQTAVRSKRVMFILSYISSGPEWPRTLSN